MNSEHWHHILDEAGHLSDRFRDRHAIVLAQLSATAAPEMIDAAESIAAAAPANAERALLGFPAPGHDHHARSARLIDHVSGAGSIRTAVERLLAHEPCVECLITSRPVLEQTRVPLHPSRRATLVECGQTGSLVGLQWPASSVSLRAKHRAEVAKLAAHVNRSGHIDDARFAVPDEYAIAWPTVGGDPWVFAPNYGPTLEDELRTGLRDPVERERVVSALVRLRAAMLENGVVWQGFAPRNMFHRQNEILLIDFEDVTHIETDPLLAAQQLLWHRVFFADCLSPAEYGALFADTRDPAPSEGALLNADAFEHALLGVQKVTWAQRKQLLEGSARLEGRHARPEPHRDGGILYGHGLGHYWGDFLSAEVESTIYQHLVDLEDEAVLTACLEVFEAAMEADICRGLRLTAAGESPAGCPRTEAVTAQLVSSGEQSLAAARSSNADWYACLREDPAALVDSVLFAAHTAQSGLDRAALSTYLIGAQTSRASHSARLADALDIGIDFLHPAPAAERFFHFAEPDELRSMLAEDLPVDGEALRDVLTQVRDSVARHSVSQAAPGYLAFPDAGNAVAALAGSILTPMLNQNLIAVDRSAPSATFATIQVTEWLRELVGYPSAPITSLRGVRDVAGLWTTGGHLSNHVAMLAALGRAFPAARKLGLRALDTQPAVVMAGPISHYSHTDAAFHLGLGWDSVLSVEATANFTTDPAAVDRMLSHPPTGVTPFMVVGVAGNCRTTGLDDLAALAEVSRRHNVWFHVDACHGGSLIFNEQLRKQCLPGLERADSVSLDPHKGLFTPYPSSYVVFRERGILTQFSRHTDTVLADGCWDLGLVTPFLGSTGFEALPTWMLLKHVGTRRLGAMVSARQALVRHLERRIDESGLFVRLNDVDFYRLAFVFCPPQARALLRRLDPAARKRAAHVISHFTSRLNTMLYRDGRVCFDEHTLVDLADRVGLGADAKYTIMACCPGNPLTTQHDLDQAVRALSEAARPLAADLTAALHDTKQWQQGPQRPGGPAGWDDE